MFSAEGTAVERGVYAASTHDCQQATDCSNALLLATLKRRERRAPLNTYERGLGHRSAMTQEFGHFSGVS
jgi:hypothetical protein